MSSKPAKSLEYRLIVIELDDIVPRRDPKKPNLYVAKTVIPPEERFLAVQRSKKSNWYTGRALRLRQDLTDSRTYKSSEAATKACAKLTRSFRVRVTPLTETRRCGLYMSLS